MSAIAAAGSWSETGSTRGWIHSPRFDLALFTLSPLAGLLVLWANFKLPGGLYVVVAATYLIGIPHYLSSFSFFLGDDNLSYYRTRRAAFFAGPVIILALVVGLHLAGQARWVQVTMFTWNIYHVSYQSAGILSLYRRLNGGPYTERPVAHLAILAVNATLAFWFVDRFPPLYDLLARIHPLAPWVLRAITLPVALSALGILAWRIRQRPKRLSMPEGAFLASSLVLFHPYLWVTDSNLATFGMLMGHFIQYLSIVWLLHQRKYAHLAGSPHQRLLGQIAARPALLFGTIAGSGLVFYLANKAAVLIGAPLAYIILWNALTLVHFYLDGLIWAFKRPFVRESIGPYLTPASHFAAP